MKAALFTLTIIIVTLASTPSFANNMIGNSATGYVSGSITQIATNGSSNLVTIGSIIDESGRGISNVSVSARVDGDIYVATNSSNMHVNVGSYIQR